MRDVLELVAGDLAVFVFGVFLVEIGNFPPCPRNPKMDTAFWNQADVDQEFPPEKKG